MSFLQEDKGNFFTVRLLLLQRWRRIGRRRPHRCNFAA
jgi:hypothetical protein